MNSPQKRKKIYLNKAADDNENDNSDESNDEDVDVDPILLHLWGIARNIAYYN